MNMPAYIDRCFCSGRGQYNSRANGEKPYDRISMREIVALVREPDCVDKANARWFIPSNYSGSDGRSFAVQREQGEYGCLAADVDSGNHSLEQVRAAVTAIVGEAAYLVYASRSSQAEARKWRVLVPLAAALPAADYGDIQGSLFDLLSGQGVECDRALSRSAQLIFLPNKGDHYEHHVGNGRPLDLIDHTISRTRDAIVQAREDAIAAAASDRARRKEQRTRSGQDSDVSVIDHFNAHHTIEDLFWEYGYERRGTSNDWRSPMQTSGTFATRVLDEGDAWVSLSGSDADAGVGAETRHGHRFGDAFDTFVHFGHSGDVRAAVSAYAARIGLSRTNQPDLMDLTHDALAEELGAQGWDQDARFVAASHRWYFLCGTHWRKDERRENMTRTRVFLRQRANDLLAWAEKKAAALQKTDDERGAKDARKIKDWAETQAKMLRHKNTVAAVESLAQSNSESATSHDVFDRHLHLLGTPGGTVDLRSGLLRPSMQSDMHTYQTQVAPGGGRPVRWLNFLDEIFDGDQAVIDFMQRAAGYALTGETREHKMLFLYGGGRNGKSVFMETLFFIWNDYARRAPVTTFLQQKNREHATNIAGLQGARLVAGSELPKGRTWDEAVIKDLTGGDRMAARFMRGDYFEFEPQLTLFIAGNTQPSFRGLDEAIRARVVLVPFTVTIPPKKRDQQLMEKLKAEAPQILQWAIEGARIWYDGGLQVPASIVAASEQYFADEDLIGQFLADETIEDPAAFSAAPELHARFGTWCQRQGLAVWTQLTFKKQLVERGIPEHRTKKARGFLGLRLVDDEFGEEG